MLKWIVSVGFGLVFGIALSAGPGSDEGEVIGNSTINGTELGRK